MTKEVGCDLRIGHVKIERKDKIRGFMFWLLVLIDMIKSEK